MTWEKHVIKSSPNPDRMTDALLQFLNQHDVPPGGLIIREEGREIDKRLGGLVHGNEPRTLTVLIYKQ